MRTLVVFLLSFAVACRPAASSQPSASSGELGARSDSLVPGRVPQPVWEAFHQLDRELSAMDRATIRKTPPERMIDYHFGLGMYVRNEFGLWSGGGLQRYFLDHGLQHPDEMSGVLLDAYRLYLRGEPVNMDSLIATAPSPKPEATPEPDSVARP